MMTENYEMRANIELLTVELVKGQADNEKMIDLKQKMLSEQKRQMHLMQEMHVSQVFFV